MLKPEDNELLTRVGPGTAMGDLLRRFWLPALLEEEVHEKDGAPVRLRLLGEDLVAFRDTDGKLGVLDAYCAHRRTHLYFGRNEECGIRCVYHGWKYDVTGQCVDMPAEPAESDFKDKVRTKSYPTATRGGVVWIYMGPPELETELPDFEWARLPGSRCEITKRSSVTGPRRSKGVSTPATSPTSIGISRTSIQRSPGPATRASRREIAHRCSPSRRPTTGS